MESGIQQYISEIDSNIFKEISPILDIDEKKFKSFAHELRFFYEVFDRLVVIKEINCTYFSPIHPTTQFALLNGFVPKQKQWATIQMDQWTLSQVLLDSAKEIGYIKNDDQIKEIDAGAILELSKKYFTISKFILELIRFLAKNPFIGYKSIYHDEHNLKIASVGGNGISKSCIIDKKILFQLFSHFQEKQGFETKAPVSFKKENPNIFKGKNGSVPNPMTFLKN